MGSERGGGQSLLMRSYHPSEMGVCSEDYPNGEVTPAIRTAGLQRKSRRIDIDSLQVFIRNGTKINSRVIHFKTRLLTQCAFLVKGSVDSTGDVLPRISFEFPGLAPHTVCGSPGLTRPPTVNAPHRRLVARSREAHHAPKLHNQFAQNLKLILDPARSGSGYRDVTYCRGGARSVAGRVGTLRSSAGGSRDDFPCQQGVQLVKAFTEQLKSQRQRDKKRR